MLSFAPNISWLLADMPFEERVELIAKAGFKAIEFGFPSHTDLEVIQQAHDDWGLNIVLFNQDVAIWDEQNRGYLVDPDRRDEFKHELDTALDLAQKLGVMKIMLCAGVTINSLRRETQTQCMIDNLLYAAPLAEQVGVLLTIEALNPIDNPGYFLTSSHQGINIVKQVNHPSVRFQFDTYHLQMMEGDLVNTLRGNYEWIGHIQFADYPGRHEPGTGRVNFDQLIKTIQNVGYLGYIGLEYIPTREGEATFNWISDYLCKESKIIK